MNGSEVMLHITCNDCDLTERAIIDLFKTKYKLIDEYGSEYFEGDQDQMIKDICDLVFRSK